MVDEPSAGEQAAMAMLVATATVRVTRFIPIFAVWSLIPHIHRPQTDEILTSDI